MTTTLSSLLMIAASARYMTNASKKQLPRYITVTSTTITRCGVAHLPPRASVLGMVNVDGEKGVLFCMPNTHCYYMAQPTSFTQLSQGAVLGALDRYASQPRLLTA